MLNPDQIPDAHDILDPRLEAIPATIDGENCYKVYLEVFVPAHDQNGQEGDWRPRPVEDWHLLAVIFANRIVTYPVFTNPYANRYLTPRHSAFETITFEYANENDTLPEEPGDAISDAEGNLPSTLFNPWRYGLGFVKELEVFVHQVGRLGNNIEHLTVSLRRATVIDGNTVVIAARDLSHINRRFDSLTTAGRRQIRSYKATLVQNSILNALDPVRFPHIDTGQQPQHLAAALNRNLRQVRENRQASVRTVRRQLHVIAAEQPAALLELHAEIERVTLQAMIERFDQMMGQTLTENRWQSFFEANLFILTMLFSRPVRLIEPQFHAQGANITGAGAVIGDFLLGELGQGLAIVEIKKPATPLMRRTAYRNNVFGPDNELSGAVTQVLSQQEAIREQWLLHRVAPALAQSRPDAIKCVVVAGRLPTAPDVLKSFNLFRHACKDVEVITFDELLEKLRLLHQHLSQGTEQNPGEPPVTEVAE